MFLPLIAALMVSQAAPPSAPAPASVEASPPVTGHLTIRFANAVDNRPVAYRPAGGVIVLTATVAGREISVLVDNRVEHNVIDLALARSAKLAVIDIPGRKMTTPTGSVPLTFVDDVPFVVPGAFESRASMGSIDMTSIARLAGQPVQAILGRDFLAHMAILVDTVHHTIRFGPSGSLRTPPTLTAVDLLDTRPHVVLSVNGKPVTVTVDLGSNGGLALTPTAWARVGDPKATFVTGHVAHAEGQTFAVQQTRVPAVSVGQVTAKDVLTDVRPLPVEDSDGLVGLGVLGQFEFALDIERQKLWLIPVLAGPTAPAATKPAS